MAKRGIAVPRSVQRANELVRKLQQPATPATVAPPVVLPPGLPDMLKLKVKLQQELQLLTKKPVIVSVDLIKNEWVFCVRGIKPPMAFYSGHKVLFFRAHAVGLENS